MSQISHDAGELDRRRFIRRAVTVAWATPLILTLTAGAASAAACRVVGGGNCGGSCITAGTTCKHPPPPNQALCQCLT